jgi:hypothetical protein
VPNDSWLKVLVPQHRTLDQNSGIRKTFHTNGRGLPELRDRALGAIFYQKSRVTMTKKHPGVCQVGRSTGSSIPAMADLGLSSRRNLAFVDQALGVSSLLSICLVVEIYWKVVKSILIKIWRKFVVRPARLELATLPSSSNTF